MTDRPILFSGPMVRAIINGRKKQTRRIINVKKYSRYLSDYYCTGRLFDYETDKHGLEFVHKLHGLWHPSSNPHGRSPWYIPVQYHIGDNLWVREAHALVPETAYRLSTGVQQAVNPTDNYQACIYRSGWDRSDPGVGWRPSIHMPRWASRLTLIVTDVRVQRLQDISEDEAQEEGIYEFRRIGDDPGHASWGYDGCAWRSQTPRGAFVDLWDSLATPGSIWVDNPWVAAITYIVHRCNIDALFGIQSAAQGGGR